MGRPAAILVAVQAAAVAGLAYGLRSGRMPLGVTGEWTWQAVKGSPTAMGVMVASAGLAGFAGLAAAGFRAMGGEPGRFREAAWVLALIGASIVGQGAVQEGAPEGYGLAKWIIALSTPGSSGYYTVAKTQMADPWRFLAEYPAWIARQDALHVGTHPPGLFLVARGMLGLMEAHPGLARAVVAASPGSSGLAIRAMGLPRADSASLALTGALILMACSATVGPMYILARASLAPKSAWACASLWPMASSALVFQPTADAAFPLLATTALALAAWSRRVGVRSGLALAAGSGVVLAVGMEFTLAFLAVGLVVGLVSIAPRDRGWGLGAIAATGAGFLAATLAWWAWSSADPFAIWWTNQRNHARFYVEYPRNYRAWLVANPIELAVGLGLPATIWAVAGLASGKRSSREAWATLAVLATMTLTGRSLSEVGRLWLPLMPPILVAAGWGFERMGGGAKALGATVVLMGAQALALEWTIQVVYPI